jgi:hypothetical protein
MSSEKKIVASERISNDEMDKGPHLSINRGLKQGLNTGSNRSSYQSSNRSNQSANQSSNGGLKRGFKRGFKRGLNQGYERTKGCCNYFCNKRGLFTEIDMSFSNMMELIPNSNVSCRCCNKLFTAPIFQGRSCACLIRPKQRRPFLYNSARGCSPDRCGCNNFIFEELRSSGF